MAEATRRARPSLPRRVVQRLRRMALGALGATSFGTITAVRTTEPLCAITFDGGPDEHWTPQVLDVLDAHGAKATFFVIGKYVDAHPDVIERLHAAALRQRRRAASQHRAARGLSERPRVARTPVAATAVQRRDRAGARAVSALMGRRVRVLTVAMTQFEAKAQDAKGQRRPGLPADLRALVREDGAVPKRLLKTRELTDLARFARPIVTTRAFRPLLARLKSCKRRSRRPRGAGGVSAANAANPIQAERPTQVDFLAAKTDVSIDKARRLLGYAPAFDLGTGMALTGAYLRWANRLPAEEE